jgi:hypothetical protein
MAPDLLTAAGFLTERQDLLYVYVVKRGSGWDVVLRVDGTYHDRANAEDAAVDIRDWVSALTDVGKSDRLWWGGPPDSDASEVRPSPAGRAEYAPAIPPLPASHAGGTTSTFHAQPCADTPRVVPIGERTHAGASRRESSRAGRG